MATYPGRNRHHSRDNDYVNVTNADEASRENAKKSMSKFSSVKVKSKVSKSKIRAHSTGDQPLKRGGSQSLPSSPPNEVENDSTFIGNYRNNQIITQSAPNSPQSQRKLLGSQTTNNRPRSNKQRQLPRASSLSDIYSKDDFDKSSSNLTRIRKLSVGSVEVLRGVGLNDTAAERERKFVAKYSNAEEVIEQKNTSKTTTIMTQNGNIQTQNQRIITSKVQRKIVTQSSVQQTITSKTNSRSLDDQHIVKYRNRPVILQRKRSLGSIEISRQKMMNFQNKESPPKGRMYRSSSLGAIKHALQNTGQEQLPNKGNITTTLTISTKKKADKSTGNNPARADTNVKPYRERKIQNDHVVADIIKPTKTAGSESQPTFNSRISKATIAPVATSSINVPATKANVQALKNTFNEHGRPGGNKGIATTVKVNGKVVATKVTNDPSHPVKSTVTTKGYASSKNGTASTAAPKSKNVSYNGNWPTINSDRYASKPSGVAKKY